MNNEDILQEIPDDKLPELKNLFKANWPYAMSAYYWLQNYIEWKKRNVTNVQFLSPDGRWNDGTFIAIVQDGNKEYDLYMFSLEKNCDRLRDALIKTSKIKWNEKQFTMFFRMIHEAHQPTALNEVQRRGMDLLHLDVSNMWWICKEEAINYQYEIPSDVYIAPLKEENVELINSVWPYRNENSTIHLTKFININGGFGIYLKNNNSLVSWAIKNGYGALGVLQTLQEHQRKGYARILIKHFAKYWAGEGLDTLCYIMTYNDASTALFQKLGWKQEYQVSWFRAKSK